MSGPPAGPEEWAGRFEQQALACEHLGSPLYARLLTRLAEEVRAKGPTWAVMAGAADLRFGQYGQLRLLGAAHRLALSGRAPQWAAVLPSCGGEVPDSDDDLLAAWATVIDAHPGELAAGLRREVQTNEVGRAAGLALALAEAHRNAPGLSGCTLVELGCSAGLNLRLDHLAIDLAGVVLGDAASSLELRPELPGGLDALRHDALVLPRIERRVGIDPLPVDPTTQDGLDTLVSFLWPDQLERIERLRTAAAVARRHPAELMATGPEADTATVLREVLDGGGPAAVQHSIVWQYIPTELRWRITALMEELGSGATDAAPLVWVRYEPDEWNRNRSAIWLRTWPGGADRLVAHVDYHGRWLHPLPMH